MIRRKIYTQQMLARVFDFGETHAELFSKDTIARELLASIGSALTKLSGHASFQVSGDGAVRTSSVSRIEARKALKTKLETIDQTARAMKLEQFFMPRRRSDAATIAAGEAFARDAEPLKEQFIKQGLPAGFIEDLNAAVGNLRRAGLDHSSSKGARAAAVAGFDDSLKQALSDLERFDALVINTLRDNPAVMAEWKIARHVGRPPVSKPAPAPDAATAA